MSIHVLDPQVASKIAAGEVVERPASVVKELMENAIDAGASLVQVEIRDGGLDLVRVVDNGCGIPSDEMALAFQHHATSKIVSLDDLQVVRTLGFRGEALYSVAAVAKVTVFSRTQGDLAGSFLDIAGGAISNRGQRASPFGTTVTVRHLFYNVPARLKFTKAPEIEAGRITALLSVFALAYPALQFRLISNGRPVFQSTGSGSLYDALVKVFGLETAAHMIEVSGDAAGLPDERETEGRDPAAGGDPGTGRGAAPAARVAGYVSQPSVTRATRSYLHFFVNHRCVQSPLLSRAVEDAYRTMLPVGRHPVAVLNVSVPPEELDVNVHPAKAEVKFLRDREVFAAVQRAVRSALTMKAEIPDFGPVALQGPTPGVQMPMAAVFRAPDAVGAGDAARSMAVFAPPEQGTREEIQAGGKLPPLRIVGQMAQTYIIAEAPDGMYLIDQHTAHERVLYDRLAREHARLAVRSQLLLEPMTLDLTPRQRALLEPRVGQLAEMGFRLEAFGERAYLLRAIPAILPGTNPTQAILELIDLVADEKASAGNWQEALLITMACHGAVRAGQTLSPDEMRQLVAQLEATALPRTCPHGRPTLLHISQAQLEREFGRR